MTDNNFDTPPAVNDVTEHFWDHFNGLSEKGNLFAMAVSSVDFADGMVTITIDPQSAGATREALYSVMPQPWEKWAATPISFWNDKEVWLRTVVHSVRVEDIDGTLLGTGSAEQFSTGNHPDNIKGDS